MHPTALDKGVDALFEDGRVAIPKLPTLGGGFKATPPAFGAESITDGVEGISRRVEKGDGLGDAKARYDAGKDAFATVNQDEDDEVWLAESIAIADGSRIEVGSQGVSTNS